MATLPFTQVDVFGSRPLSGNPLAVVHDAAGLATEQLQAFARWTGLSETTFLLPPTSAGADYRVRIFTTSRELPFAGHPTLGSAYAWLTAGGRPRTAGVVVQECGAGLVQVRRTVDRLAFAAPPLTRSGPLDPALRERVTRGLGLQPDEVVDAAWLVNGPEWIGLWLPSAERVLAVTPDPTILAGLDLGIAGPWPPGSEVAIEVRALLPGGSPAEDPVTGSLNAGLGTWLIGAGRVPADYVAAQGAVVGTAGRVYVKRDDEALWVGGSVSTVIAGTVEI